MTEIWRGTWVVAYRELLRFVNERSRLVSSMAFPLIFLVIFGAGFGKIIGSLAPGIDYIKFMYPGIVAQSVLTSSLFAGVSVVWDREYGFLREILVAPIARSGIVLGKAIGATVTALLQVLILLVLTPVVGVSLTPETIITLIPVVAILAFGLSGLGILIASFMTSQQGFQFIIQLLIFPLIFLAGVFFPVNMVPGWLEVVSKVNPLTYGVDAIRQIFLGSEATVGTSILRVTVLGHTMSLLDDVTVVGSLGALLIAGAVIAFNRQE